MSVFAFLWSNKMSMLLVVILAVSAVLWMVFIRLDSAEAARDRYLRELQTTQEVLKSLEARHKAEMDVLAQNAASDRARRARVENEKGKNHEDTSPVSPAIRDALSSVRELRRNPTHD